MTSNYAYLRCSLHTTLLDNATFDPYALDHLIQLGGVIRATLEKHDFNSISQAQR